jgi:hypothetical protein
MTTAKKRKKRGARRDGKRMKKPRSVSRVVELMMITYPIKELFSQALHFTIHYTGDGDLAVLLL